MYIYLKFMYNQALGMLRTINSIYQSIDALHISCSGSLACTLFNRGISDFVCSLRETWIGAFYIKQTTKRGDEKNKRNKRQSIEKYDYCVKNCVPDKG